MDLGGSYYLENLLENLLEHDEVIAVSVGITPDGHLLRLRVECVNGIETYLLPLFLLNGKGRLGPYD